MSLVSILSCGAPTEPAQPPSNPLPVMTAVEPAQLVMGASPATITISGSGFIQGSQVRWNGSDRVTHFVSAQALTAELLSSDVAAVSTGKVTVVNGAPGGGTSGNLNVTVVRPVPAITAVSPSTITRFWTTGSQQITITGTGFTPESRVRLGVYFHEPTSMTPTELVVLVADVFLMNAGTLELSVDNPAPGGGTSNVAEFTVTNPVPTITSLAPDTAHTGAGFTLTINGTAFGNGSVVRWNGSDRATTVVSATRLTAAIAADDVATADTVAVSVFNPSPGGGESNAIAYAVVEAPPVITGIEPGTITAGAGATSVTLTGTNFRTGATVQWDGQDRSSSPSGTGSLTVALTAEDVAVPRTGALTVTNPGASGVSNAMALTVVPPSMDMSVTKVIPLTHAGLVADDLRAVLYASVPSTAGAPYANSIVRLDPSTGAITGSVEVGTDPGPLAITDDGQYLYVGLSGASKVIRVALASLSKDIEIALPGNGFFGGAFARDIVSIPGAPRSVAVSLYFKEISPSHAGTVLFDDGTPRPVSVPSDIYTSRLTRSATGARLYGLNDQNTSGGFYSILVAPDGLHVERLEHGLVTDVADIEYDGGFVYATTGDVVDPVAMRRLATIPAIGIVRPDAANARVHFLTDSTVQTYHYTTFTELGTFADVSLEGHSQLVRWGPDGLAVGGGATIILLRGSLIAP